MTKTNKPAATKTTKRAGTCGALIREGRSGALYEYTRADGRQVEMFVPSRDED